jgi:hypothetical protein
MDVTNSQEIWQIDAGGQIYEARFEELAEWIEEGSLLRQDKVRRGSLRWIEAHKVPGLIKFFNEKDSGNIVVSTTAAGLKPENLKPQPENFSASVPATSFQDNSSTAESFEEIAGFDNPPKDFQNESDSTYSRQESEQSAGQNISQLSGVCCVHAEAAAEYFCETCANAFCKLCPSSYGGSVKICPFCGAMCQSIKKYNQEQQKRFRVDAAVYEAFGLIDFSRALEHPFKFKTSFIFGAIIFAVFSFGQSAAVIGGMFMMFSALFCVLASNMLTFGILANIVDNFSQGKLETNFMPDFDDFSLWDDVVHPFFLSIGAYIASFGPFIMVLIVGVYLVINSMTAQINTVKDEITKIPGTEFYDNRKTARQSDEVKQLTENLRKQNEQRLNRQTEIASGNQPTAINEENAESERLSEMIQQSRKEQLESVVGQSPETQQKEYAQMFRGVLNLAAPLVIFGFLAFLWGLFYFPAACAVAGFTRSFTATINPFVGLDTIKRLGFDYAKILLMSLVMLIMTTVAGMVLSIVFSPFNIPQMGNLPAKVVGSIFTFYFSIVFSCVLGYALFKNADKLKLHRG